MKNRTDMDAVDDLYVYEIAGLLGIGESDEGETFDDDLADLSPSARLAVQRMRADALGLPPPETPPPDEGVLALMQRAVM